ncbi:MAG TPA: glycosyltransferase [Candidatus Acidoferrum sp.]|nr:glycosyltransferase [Candidatus Acidoferrum sp.]
MTWGLENLGLAALVISGIGVLSSLVFLVLSVLGARKFHQESEQQRQAAERVTQWPAVSVLKPVHGVEARLRENVESFFRQDYPSYEILFAADEENDAALPIVREVAANYPNIPCRILVTGLPQLPNPPAYSFYRMSEVAAHDILVTSDSDVEVAPSYLREVVAPMLDPATGMVTCLYRGKNAGGFWSGMDAIGMSVEMSAGVLTANLLEGMKFGLGPTIVTRKDSIAKIGGYQVTGEYFSNDFVTGNFIEKAGYRVALSRHVIDHVVPPMTFRRMWERQVRWAKGTRWSRPKGHFGTGLIFAMPYGLLGLVAGGATGHWFIGGVLFAIALMNRIVETWLIGWGVVRDRRARNEVWLYPLRDLLGFAVWCASYLSKRAVWRDHRYQLLRGGRIVLREQGQRT